MWPVVLTSALLTCQPEPRYGAPTPSTLGPTAPARTPSVSKGRAVDGGGNGCVYTHKRCRRDRLDHSIACVWLCETMRPNKVKRGSDL